MDLLTDELCQQLLDVAQNYLIVVIVGKIVLLERLVWAIARA